MKIKEPFVMYLQRKKNNIANIKEEHISQLFQEIFLNFKFELFSINPETEKDPDVLIRFLFFICVISDRLEIAKTFWKMGKVCGVTQLLFLKELNKMFSFKGSNCKCFNRK